jgi:PhnB protein
MQTNSKINSAFFITFSGECKKALTMYQDCFGGNLYFETFDKPIAGIKEMPVVSGSLLSEKIAIYGSDLVHNEGRRVGNFMSIYILCNNFIERLDYLKKLGKAESDYSSEKYRAQKWIEITDPFEVRWVFGI